MKKLVTIVAVLCAAWMAATLPVNGQDVGFFQNTHASAIVVPPHTTMSVQEALDKLKLVHGFTYQMAPGTDSSVLSKRFSSGTFKDDSLAVMLQRILLPTNAAVSFNGKVMTIHGQPLTQVSGGNRSGMPTLTGDAPDGEVSDDNYTTQKEPYLSNTPIPPVRRYPAAGPEQLPQHNARQDYSRFVPAVPSWADPWSDDYYSWPMHEAGYGYVGTKVSPRDAQNPYFMARLNGQRGHNYNRGAIGGYNSSYYSAWGAGPYWGQSADDIYKIMNRNPEHLRTHGLIKINGPDALLRKVRVVIDGADVVVASKSNNKWNQPIVLLAGEHKLELILEEKNGIFKFERKIRVEPADVSHSLTGDIKPMDIRVSLNEFRYAEGLTAVPQPTRPN